MGTNERMNGGCNCYIARRGGEGRGRESVSVCGTEYKVGGWMWRADDDDENVGADVIMCVLRGGGLLKKARSTPLPPLPTCKLKRRSHAQDVGISSLLHPPLLDCNLFPSRGEEEVHKLMWVLYRVLPSPSQTLFMEAHTGSICSAYIVQAAQSNSSSSMTVFSLLFVPCLTPVSA